MYLTTYSRILTTDIVQEGSCEPDALKKPQALDRSRGGSSIDSAKAIIYYGNAIRKMFWIRRVSALLYRASDDSRNRFRSYRICGHHRSCQEYEDSAYRSPDALTPRSSIRGLSKKRSRREPPGNRHGCSAWTHAVEAYSSTNNNPFARCYAAKAAELVFKSLYDAYEDAHDLNAKASMQIASCMAGIAFNSSGLGITHSSLMRSDPSGTCLTVSPMRSYFRMWCCSLDRIPIRLLYTDVCCRRWNSEHFRQRAPDAHAQHRDAQS